MAKKKDKNSAKSLAMVLVTGMTLVAVTLCWFVMSNKNQIDKVDNIQISNEESSFANIYYGADASGNIAISPDRIVEYKQIKDNLIVLENMFPGAEYTYVAKFTSARTGQKITLDLNGIKNVGTGTLLSSVELNRSISKIQGEDEGPRYTANKIFLGAEDSNPFEYTVVEDGEHWVFYSFKITEDTTSVKENMSIEITNIDAVISDV